MEAITSDLSLNEPLAVNTSQISKYDFLSNALRSNILVKIVLVVVDVVFFFMLTSLSPDIGFYNNK